jgi:hypothetical protein
MRHAAVCQAHACTHAMDRTFQPWKPSKEAVSNPREKGNVVCQQGDTHRDEEDALQNGEKQSHNAQGNEGPAEGESQCPLYIMVGQKSP